MQSAAFARNRWILALFLITCCFVSSGTVLGDGKIVAPREYKGSLEERAQEAVIIFHGSEGAGGAVEDLILKISVLGEAERFAWVVPLPDEPKVEKEDARLFEELFNYVEARRPRVNTEGRHAKAADVPAPKGEPVQVLSRRIVGNFDVNLYVFYRWWINDSVSKYGYVHRGLELRYRDWDSPECEPNGGKAYTAPGDDPFLKSMATRIPSVTKLLQKLHPGEKYYLTNISARNLKPGDVRNWSDDLWLFPYYTNSKFVPFDARPGGPAAGAWIPTSTADRARK